MQIFHFSDTHLWIWLENTTREEDFYKNFEFVINEILQKKPDIVIHSWDLFHTSKPSNKAISVVVENFLKLEKAWIKVIIIAWNHDTPRLSLTTHPFEIFQSMENFYVFYEPKIESIELNVETFQKQEVQGRKNFLKWVYEHVSDWKKSFSDEEISSFSKVSWVNFVVLPHIHDENIFKEELRKAGNLLKENTKNIFISHFWISAKEYDEYTDEISGINITLEELNTLKKFDYVALGHYHKQFNIRNICYPGSIEHTSFNQKNYKIGYNIFDSNTLKKESFELPSRPMIDLWVIDCKDIFTTKDLVECLEKSIDTKTLKDAIVKIILLNITSKLLLEFDEKLFLSFFSDTFYFEYKKIKFQENNTFQTSIHETSNTILDNFEIFFDNYDFSDTTIKKEELKKDLQNLITKI